MTARQEALEGLEPDGVQVTFLGAKLALGSETEPYVLGESVEFTIKGHVVLVGEEALETEGVRRVVKIRCDHIFAK